MFSEGAQHAAGYQFREKEGGKISHPLLGEILITTLKQTLTVLFTTSINGVSYAFKK